MIPLRVNKILLIPVLFMIGCASQSPYRDGSYVDVFPVTYTLSLKLDNEGKSRSKDKFDQYLQDHKEQVLSQPIELSWTSSEGELFKNTVEKQLLSIGVNQSNISTVKGVLQKDYFDFRIRIVQNYVSPSNCSHAKSSQFFGVKDGCYVENMRWQSIVSPEKMLHKNSLFSNEQKGE